MSHLKTEKQRRNALRELMRGETAGTDSESESPELGNDKYNKMVLEYYEAHQRLPPKRMMNQMKIRAQPSPILSHSSRSSSASSSPSNSKTNLSGRTSKIHIPRSHRFKSYAYRPSYKSIARHYNPERKKKYIPTDLTPATKGAPKPMVFEVIDALDVQGLKDARQTLIDKYNRLHPYSDKEKRANAKKQIAHIEKTLKTRNVAYKVLSQRDMANEINKFL